MSEETRTMQTADPAPTSAPEDVPALVKKIGRTTYMVRVHFSKTSTETMSDKIKRMLKMVRVHFSKTSTETMSDKIKRMLKNEIQQM